MRIVANETQARYGIRSKAAGREIWKKAKTVTIIAFSNRTISIRPSSGECKPKNKGVQIALRKS